MASDHAYNGWSNYPTWNWKLWIDNDQGDQEYWREQVEYHIRQNDDDDKAIRMLASQLEANADEMLDDRRPNNGPIADILGWAMGQIDWHEIAESMIGDLDDDEKRELRGQEEESPDENATV